MQITAHNHQEKEDLEEGGHFVYRKLEYLS